MQGPTCLALIHLVIFLCTGVGGFSCYKCRSGTACDTVTKDMETECASTQGDVHSCIKADVDGKVIRDCGIPSSLAHECRLESGVRVCMCTSNLCNGVTSWRRYNWALFVALTVAGILLFVTSLQVVKSRF
ncbi:uncharacterized protein LOC129589852 isoform X2 [Paramacrobiotus metropolitanus]|uniref:uncharacterized protein LOC129589852 isoform X2 n=1 Tax=Paramacrobiotus metropolitanus TaxID=2943436 RepID=UPI002445B6DD|nr:uncharacterized protein LOC129589852 isoform X2 [Paramacrobiotus metropolitanus]